MAKTTREVVDKYYETVNAGKWDEWLTLFDDDIVMEEQLAGHVEGIDVLRGAVGGLKTGYAKFQMLPQETTIDGEKATVIWRCVAESADGGSIDAPGAN